uniref:Uncharacterized protein n=1 Tax=Glossina pallidipes TaxID=7398 RepID=A0A1A9ZG35_GLOPL
MTTNVYTVPTTLRDVRISDLNALNDSSDYLSNLISGINLILFLYTLRNPSELFFLKTLVCVGCVLATLQDESVLILLHHSGHITNKFKMLYLRNQRSYAPGCWSALYSLDCASTPSSLLAIGTYQFAGR